MLWRCARRWLALLARCRTLSEEEADRLTAHIYAARDAGSRPANRRPDAIHPRRRLDHRRLGWPPGRGAGDPRPRPPGHRGQPSGRLSSSTRLGRLPWRSTGGSRHSISFRRRRAPGGTLQAIPASRSLFAPTRPSARSSSARPRRCSRSSTRAARIPARVAGSAPPPAGRRRSGTGDADQLAQSGRLQARQDRPGQRRLLPEPGVHERAHMGRVPAASRTSVRRVPPLSGQLP